MRWVASPPDAFRPREPLAPRRRYSGPPAYAEVPRWSLWPWATPVRPGDPEGPPTRPDPMTPDAALRATAGLLRRLALTTAILAVVAAAGEVWRYALLLASRSAALSSAPLAWSDALVTLAGLLAPATALATGAVFLRWLLQAHARAADVSGTVPARPRWAVLVGAVLPPTTLTVPGAVLAEIEHAASGRPAGQRPAPSRPVLVWWAAWAASVVLGLVTVLHGFARSTQALADGVVLHALVDVVAAVAAVATVRVVSHLTELLAPELRPSGRSWVAGVRTPTPAAG